MSFSLVVLSLLVIVGIDECWGADLTETEMKLAAVHFTNTIGAFEGILRNSGKQSNRKAAYTTNVQNKIGESEKAFKKFTKTSLEGCVNALINNTQFHPNIITTLNSLCDAFKKDETLKNRVIFKDDIKELYKKIPEGETDFNNNC